MVRRSSRLAALTADATNTTAIASAAYSSSSSSSTSSSAPTESSTSRARQPLHARRSQPPRVASGRRKRQIAEEDEQQGLSVEGDTSTNVSSPEDEQAWRATKRVKEDLNAKGKEKLDDHQQDEPKAAAEEPSAGNPTTSTTNGNPPGPPDCSVCFEPIKVQGEINSCDHPFCFECISTWAEKANVCPLCKRRFTSITKKALGGQQVTPLRVGGRSGRGGQRARGASSGQTKVRVRKRDLRFTESDEEFYYREFYEQAAREEGEYDSEGDEYDSDDGFIASDDEWWTQEFRPGFIFERVLAARGRFGAIHIDLSDVEEEYADDDTDDVFEEDRGHEDVDSLSSAGHDEAVEGGGDDEDGDFQRQLAEAMRLSLEDQTAAASPVRTRAATAAARRGRSRAARRPQPDEAETEAAASPVPRRSSRRQRRSASTPSRSSRSRSSASQQTRAPRTRAQARLRTADGEATVQEAPESTETTVSLRRAAAGRRPPRVSIIDLTGLADDGTDNQNGANEALAAEPRTRGGATRRRRRRIELEDEEDNNDQAPVGDARRRRTRRRISLDLDLDEEEETKDSSLSSSSSSTSSSSSSSSSSSTTGRPGSSSSASAVSTDDSWLFEGILP